jgi:hypothetical protein
MITATKKLKIIAAEALIGIGAMYGPIRPETNSMGRSAATTVRVAMIVGLPTSATASTAASIRLRSSGMAQCRAIFSIITIASSTRMPIEKISANRLTRLIVKPITFDANIVSMIVVGMTMAVTPASRQPMAKPISTTIETVASARWKMSSLAFSLALSP